jgi:hypothetical protein
MPDTVVIRARPATRALLRELAEANGASAIDTLERVIREAAEQRLLGALTDDLSLVREGDEAERRAWDATLIDGLDPSEDFSSWR